MFSLTSAAARQIQQAAATSGNGALALRIAARRDGDGELQCGMGFDEAKDEDSQLDLYGVSVVIAREHQGLLVDTVLDYVELQPGQFNFIFGDSRLLADDDAAASSGGGSSCGGGGSGGCASGGCAGKAPS